MKLKKNLGNLIFPHTVYLDESAKKHKDGYISIDTSLIDEKDILKCNYIFTYILKHMADKEFTTDLSSNFGGTVYQILEDKYITEERTTEKYDQFMNMFDVLYLNSKLIINGKEELANEFINTYPYNELSIKFSIFYFFVISLFSYFHPIKKSEQVLKETNGLDLFYTSLPVGEFISLVKGS